jgi:GNAT superfamily N-acetyltransferase
MSARKSQTNTLTVRPLTKDRWKDFTVLFGKNGACGGCWCRYWKLTRKEFESRKGDKNRRAMKRFVDAGNVPGLLAYEGNRPVGWVAVEPRENFSALERSRILKPVDEKPVWSAACFFVVKDCRRNGVTVELLNAAKAWVKNQGGTILEGYPQEPKKDNVPAPFAWTGFASAFQQTGFTEVARRSETRPIMRCRV